MSDLLKHIIRFIAVLGIQVFVLDRLPPLHRFVSPYVYHILVLWLPFRMSRFSLSLLGFLFGMTLDAFHHTPGLHAAALTLVAYLRPGLINLLMPKDAAEMGFAEPSARSMGTLPYFTYAMVLTLLHHTYMVLLEWLQFRDGLYFVMKVLATSGISMVLVSIAEMVFSRKSNYRTNMA